MNNHNYARIDVQAFGLSIGLVMGLLNILMGWLAISGWGAGYINMLSSFYVGYAPTFFGGVIGGIWGFIDGLIVGSLFAWFYNKFVGGGK